MKMYDVHLTPEQIDKFVTSAVCGFDSITVLGKNTNKATFEGHKYIVRVNDRYETQPYKEHSELIDIAMRMIDKYQRFIYKGFLYHSRSEFDIWIKEEI